MFTVGENFRNRIFLTLCLMGTFAILSSTMSKSPVLKLFATSLNTPEGFWMGFVASASTIPGILVSLPAASLSDVFGRRKILLVSAAVFASAPFLYLLISAWWQLVLVRFYHGFATAMFVPVTEASIAESFPLKRGERISLLSSARTVGRGVAPFLGGYILFVSDSNYNMLYLAVGVAGVTALLTSLFFLTERRQADIKPDTSETTASKLLDGWRTVAGNSSILGASFIQASQFYVFGAVEFFLVGFMKEVVQLDPFEIGVVMGIQIVAVTLTKPVMGRVSDAVGRRNPIIAGSFVGGVPLLLIPLATELSALILLSIVYGIGFAMVTASTPALVSELAPRNLTGTAMGFLCTTMDVGQTIGPLITGMVVATNLSYGGAFLALAAVLFLSTLISVLIRFAHRKDDEISLISNE
ncbi:MAG: MFS transporter [Candidatus Bathyarchaeota archaeon]|nr:MAG: MFS transporter [Candidatus Bathyarchaeota archaeon]